MTPLIREMNGDLQYGDIYCTPCGSRFLIFPHSTIVLQCCFARLKHLLKLYTLGGLSLRSATCRIFSSLACTSIYSDTEMLHQKKTFQCAGAWRAAGKITFGSPRACLTFFIVRDEHILFRVSIFYLFTRHDKDLRERGLRYYSHFYPSEARASSLNSERQRRK